MAKRGWWIGAVVLALAVTAIFLWRGWILPIRVASPEPSLTADFADTLAQTPRSVVIAPIDIDLGPAIARFEADVPRRFGSLDRRLRVDGNARVSVAFAASRTPFRVRVAGTGIVVETVVEYEGRAWYDPPIGPELSAGCGGGDNPKPRLLLRIASVPSLTPEWGLRTRTSVDVAPFSAEPRDQCRLTLLSIDVTGRVVDAVRQEMSEALARLDRHVARLDMRRRFEGIWRAMEHPIRLTDGVWLLLQPGAAQLASFGGGGDSLVAVVRLEARPRIVTGARPEHSDFLTPLPPLRSVPDGDSETGTGPELHLVLDGIFSYDAATDLARKPLVGRVIHLAGRRVRIEEVTMRGIGSGRVAVGVTFSGAVQGRVFFTGTPQLDEATRQLSVPDLELDVGSPDLRTRSVSFWLGDTVRDILRAKAVIPDSIALAGIRELAEHGMNRELADGVRLEATLTGARSLSVRAKRDYLVVRAVADGQARLAVSRVLVSAHPRSAARP